MDAFGLSAGQLVIAVEDGGTGGGNDYDYNDAYWLVDATELDQARKKKPCPDCGSPQSSSDVNAGDSTQTQTTTLGGVDAASGIVKICIETLAANGFGSGLEDNYEWSNAPDALGQGASTRGNGSGSAGIPRLLDDGSGNFRIATDATDSRSFKDDGSGNFSSRYFGGDSFSHDGSGGSESYRWKDSTGGRTDFYGFDASIPAAQRGAFKGYTGAGGRSTSTTYDGSGNLTEMTRQASTGGHTYYESFLYDYTTVDGKSLTSQVTLRRKVDAGGWGTVRSTAYEYYTSATAQGNVGDLKKLIIKDQSGNPIDTQYFRYYTPLSVSAISTSGTGATKTATVTASGHDVAVGDLVTISGANEAAFNGTFKVKSLVDGQPDQFQINVSGSAPASATGTLSMVARGYQGGMKFHFDAQSYARLIAASSESASDAAVAAYASQYIEYDSARRVSKIIQQGEGCSSCSGGLGEYIYSYQHSTNTVGANSWATKTVEVLPDGNQVVYYTNSDGQLMLRVTQELGAARSIGSISHAYASHTTTVTVTASGHGLSVGDSVIVAGVSNSFYNGIFTVTQVVDANTFKYAFPGDPGASEPTVSGATFRTVSRQWGEYFQMDADGRVILKAQPSAVDLPANLATLEQYADLLHNQAGNYQYLRDDSGLINVFDYYGSTSPTISGTNSGGVEGYLQDAKVKNGETGTAIQTSSQDYFQRSNGLSGTSAATVYPIAHSSIYSATDSSGIRTTTFGYTWFNNSTQIQSQAVSRPVVSSAQNGPGIADVDTTFFDTEGKIIWTKDADNYINYTGYDEATGSVIKDIVDVSYAKLAQAEKDIFPSGWSTNQAGLHLTTTFEVDALGRTTKMVDAKENMVGSLGSITLTGKGNVTYSVYRDFVDDGSGNNQGPEVRTYRGFDGTNTTGPIEISRQDRPGSYNEMISLAGSPSLTGGVPNGTESVTASAIRSLSRAYISLGGQLDHSDNYFSLSGQTYSTGTSLGTLSTHFLRTSYTYEKRGRTARVQSADGTIRQTFYDVLDRSTSQWMGTDDTADSDQNGDSVIDWRDFRYAVINNGSAPSGTSMYKVAENIYDSGGIGDSNLTQSRSFFGTNAADYYATKYAYDFRDRMTDSRGADNVAVKYTLNNLGEQTSAQTYADSDADFVIDSTELRARTDNVFDDQGRVYQTTVYNVSPTNGATGHTLTSNTWYNNRGMAVKVETPKRSLTVSGLMNKSQYDGAGRLVGSYVSLDTGTNEANWSDAQQLVGDQVIQQVKTIYDQAGNAIVNTTYERYETSDSSVTGELAANNSWISTAVSYFDRANRLTQTTQYGRDNGGTRYVFATNAAFIDTKDWTGGGSLDNIPDEAQGSPRGVNTSDDYIVGKVEYDDAGRAFKTTDNLGHVNWKVYDLMGRTTKTIENVPGTNSAQVETDTDRRRTTEYLYDSSGRMATMRAWNPKGSGNGIQYQDTKYLFNSPFNASWSTSTIYPDSSDTDSSGTDQVKTTYDRLGRMTSTTDQRQVVHNFSYDSAGRLSADSVTLTANTFATNVASAVLRIGKTYDDLSRVQNITSYDAASGGNAVNEVQYAYDGWGNVIRSTQAHNGTVAAAGTNAISIRYNYADGAGTNTAALYVRLSEVEYPRTDAAARRSVFYTYGAANGASDYLNRVESVRESTMGTNTTAATYSYVGLSRIVKTTHPVTTNNETLALDLGGNGVYSGLDRFGRITQQLWKKGILDGSNYDGFVYTYDRNGNIKTKDYYASGNAGNLDERYVYDGLDRLVEMRRGTLDGSNLITAPTVLMDWTLDAQGNWTSYKTVNSPKSGDVNLDGVVDISDSAILAANLGATSPSFKWTNADLNGDGTVNTTDQNIINASYGQGGGPVASNQSRTQNAANETTAISGTGVDWIDPTYDPAGNMISGPKASTGSPSGSNQAELTRLHYIYDAWNRLTYVKNDSGGNPGTTLATYEYDGLNRRIEKTVGVNTDESFYNENWQVLEVRRNGDPDAREQYTWDAGYIDTPIFKAYDALMDGTVDNYYYYMTDANHNVTAIYDSAAGQVQERYLYDPYGRVQFYDRIWTKLSSSAKDNSILYGGYVYDDETHNYYARNRYLQPTMGKWTQRDFAGYVDGANLYQYVAGNPLVASDPSGLLHLAAGDQRVRNAFKRLESTSMGRDLIRDIMALEADLNSIPGCFELNNPNAADLPAGPSRLKRGNRYDAPISSTIGTSGNSLSVMINPLVERGFNPQTGEPLRSTVTGPNPTDVVLGVPLDEALFHELTHTKHGLMAELERCKCGRDLDPYTDETKAREEADTTEDEARYAAAQGYPVRTTYNTTPDQDRWVSTLIALKRGNPFSR